MDTKSILTKNKMYQKFVALLIFMLCLTILFLVLLMTFSKGDNLNFYKLAFTVIITILVGIFIILLAFFVTSLLLWYNYPVPKISIKLLEMSTRNIYPIMVLLGKLVLCDKDTIRGAFTELNNKMVFNNSYNIENNSILILTPHCIQKSFCIHKITVDVNNCKRCGACNVDKLIGLKERYGVNFAIVTGGTLARKIIIDKKPKAIIAIACERDLISGLQDVKRLPIIAITNKRPEGPCVNTLVDIKEVENAIKHFLISKKV